MPFIPFPAVLLFHLLLCLLFGYPASRGMYGTKALHVGSLRLDANTTAPAVACAVDLVRHLPALAPFIDGEILPAHCD